MYADKYAHLVADVPNEDHWVIIKNDSVHIPGDDRSRTHPGHGYPESTKNYLSYEVYLTQEKLLEAIKELEEPRYGNRTQYKVLKVTPMSVKKQVSLSVE